MTVLKVFSFLLGIIIFLGGGILSFAPWVEDGDEYYSVDTYHNLCEDGLVLFASEECETYNTLYSIGIGMMVLGIIFLLFGIIPSTTRQPIIINNTPNTQYSQKEKTASSAINKIEVSGVNKTVNFSQNFCTNCGKRILNLAKFCTQCGTRIE
jgi:hypothetical protein